MGGGAASKPASSIKPACPGSTSPFNWLTDLTGGNVNKENKGELSLLSCGFLGALVHLGEGLDSLSCCENRVVRGRVEGKVVPCSHRET